LALGAVCRETERQIAEMRGFWPQRWIEREQTLAGSYTQRERGVNRLWCVGKGHVPLNGSGPV
jgi:hypothetical protein